VKTMTTVLATGAVLLLGCGGTVDTEGDATDDSTTDPGADTGDVSWDPMVDTEDPGPDPVDVPTDTGGEDEPGPDEHGECSSSADCGGRTCVRVPDEPGGYWMCTDPPRDEVTDCTDPPIDWCCSSDECTDGEEGGCYHAAGGWGFCGGPVFMGNICIYDGCDTDADCTDSGLGPGICVPADVHDWPRDRCAWGSCHTAADCTEEPGGYCAPVSDYCCPWRIAGFYCIYPGNCLDHPDCSGGEACVLDTESGGTRCEMVVCPL